MGFIRSDLGLLKGQECLFKVRNWKHYLLTVSIKCQPKETHNTSSSAVRRQKTEDVPNHLATGWSAETFPPEQNTIQHWAANTKLLLAIIAFHANYKSWELKCFAGWNMRNLKWQVWRFCLDWNLALLFVTPVLTDGRSDVVLRFSGGFRRRLHHSEGILNLRIKLNTLFMPCSNLI